MRLNPRAEGATILERRLTVDPKPIAFREETDRFGNKVTHLDFDDLTDRLRIESLFELETVAPEPPVDPAAPQLPWAGGPDDPMAPYRSAEAQDDAVREFASGLASESGWEVLPFLDRLNRTLFARMRHEIRAGGAAWPPARTLAAGGGACRDVATLFIAACRSLGIAAQFVSGYQAEAETPDGRRHLHAWPEAFLPGLGWRGFDPTHGLAVTDGHVALCAARTRRRPCRLKAASMATTGSPRRSNMRSGSRPAEEPSDWRDAARTALVQIVNSAALPAATRLETYWLIAAGPDAPIAKRDSQGRNIQRRNTYMDRYMRIFWGKSSRQNAGAGSGQTSRRTSSCLTA